MSGKVLAEICQERCCQERCQLSDAAVRLKCYGGVAMEQIIAAIDGVCGYAKANAGLPATNDEGMKKVLQTQARVIETTLNRSKLSPSEAVRVLDAVARSPWRSDEQSLLQVAVQSAVERNTEMPQPSKSDKKQPLQSCDRLDMYLTENDWNSLKDKGPIVNLTYNDFLFDMLSCVVCFWFPLNRSKFSQLELAMLAHAGHIVHDHREDTSADEPRLLHGIDKPFRGHASSNTNDKYIWLILGAPWDFGLWLGLQQGWGLMLRQFES